MNNRGQTLGLAIIAAIFIFMAGILIIELVKDDITLARNSDNLDCSNSGVISDGTKLTCLAIDLVIPYFFLAVFSISGGVIVSKFLK